MGFLQDWLTSLERKRLERAVAESPSPETFIRLCEILKNAHQIDEAISIAKRGYEMFPESETLEMYYKDLQKIELAHERDKLEKQIASYPNPSLYAHMAEVCRQMGDVKRGEEVCRAGLSNFPNAPGIYFVQAEIHLDANEHTKAITLLEKAISLDPKNYHAHSKLGMLYIQKGKPDKAVECFKKILEFAPSDENARIQIERATAMQEQRQGGSKDYFQQTVEPNVVMKYSTRALKELKDQEGIRGVILIDKQGLVVETILDVKVNDELMAGLMFSAFRNTNDYSRQMGQGELEQCTIFAEGGNIHVLPAKDMNLVVFADPQIKLGFIEREVQMFVQRFEKES